MLPRAFRWTAVLIVAFAHFGAFGQYEVGVKQLPVTKGAQQVERADLHLGIGNYLLVAGRDNTLIVTFEDARFSRGFPDATILFTVGPFDVGLNDQLLAGRNRTPYTGPGTYKMVSVKVGGFAYGLGTLVVNQDRRTGRFSTNDGKYVGTFELPKPIDR